MLSSKIRKVKEMPSEAILGDLEWKLLFVAQLWWAIFKVIFKQIFKFLRF